MAIETIVVEGKRISPNEIASCYEKYDNNNFSSPGEAAYCVKIMPKRDSNEDLEYRMLGGPIPAVDKNISEYLAEPDWDSPTPQANTQPTSADTSTTQSPTTTAQTPAIDNATPSTTNSISINNPFNLPKYSGSRCEQAVKMADQCCGRPETCITQASANNNNFAGQIVGFLTSAALATPGSISQMCGRMKSTSQTMTALNGYMALRCQEKVTLCRASCQPTADQIKREMKTANPQEKRNIQNHYADYLDAENHCQTANNATWQLAQQATANQLSSKMAEMCKQQITASQNTLPESQSSTNLKQNPAKETSRSNTDNNPTNQHIRAENDPTDNQSPNFKDIPAKLQKVPAPQNSSAVSLIPSSAPHSSGKSAGNQLSDFGYNTKIEKGYSFGNGYTAPLTNAFTLPFYGVSYPRAITDPDTFNFNLKDFLPGGEKNKNFVRKLASVKTINDINPAESDIFRMVSNRYYQICLRDELYDCAPLQQSGSPPN